MTDTQLLLMIGVPCVANGLLVAGLLLHSKMRLARRRISTSRHPLLWPGAPSPNALEHYFAFREAILRSELRRVEEVLKMRIKHLEGR
jgi:hypothetical protein